LVYPLCYSAAGAFAAIAAAFRLVLDVGDEAVFSEPAWFSYEPMLQGAGTIVCTSLTNGASS
jgi:aspartate/methionine/tyrosine aminotransferase